MTCWMNNVTKSTHNSLFNNRKTAGILYDSWIFDSTHPLATRAGELQDEIVEMVDRYRGEVNAARQFLAPPPTPLGDFSSQLFNQIMITANALCAGTSGSLNSTQPEGPAAVITWLQGCDPKKIAEHIQAVDIKWLTDGTLCRISISMLGFELRYQVIQTMDLATGTARHTGSPPPGTLESDLGDYCKRFSRMNLEDDV